MLDNALYSVVLECSGDPGVVDEIIGINWGEGLLDMYEVFEVLGEYRVWQEKQKAEIGDQWIEKGFVFTKWNWENMHPDTVTAWFTDFTKKQNYSINTP